MISVLVLIISVVVISLAFSRYGRREDSRLPPGNMGWPLIGETLSLFHPTTSRGDLLNNRISKYGKIFSTRLFGMTTIVSTDPELNRLILKNEGIKFETAFPRNFRTLTGSRTTGDAHKHNRSIYLKFLSPERIQTVFLRDAELIVARLLATWKEGTSVISAIEEGSKFTFYSSVKQMLNMDFQEPMVEKLRKEYHTFADGLTAVPIYIPGTKYWKAFKSRAYILNFIQQKIEAKVSNKRNGDERIGGDDFLSYLLENTNRSSVQISFQVFNTIFAGHHTTAKAVSSMLYFLKGCPKAVKQLKEERLQIIEAKKLKRESALTWDDYRGMEFTQCVIMEILRLSHVSPMIFRKSTSDFYFKEYVVPRGCFIILHTSGMHLDPMLFEDPQNFNPWRWLNPSGLDKDDAFMPFGGGIRFCVGNMLARLEMIIFLHHLIVKYELEFVEPDDSISSHSTVFSKGSNIKVRKL